MVGGRGSYYPTGCLFSITLFLKHTVVLQFLQPLRLAQQGVNLIFLKVKGQNSSVLSVLMSIERGAGKGPKATRPNFFLLLRGYIQVEGRPGSHTKCVKKVWNHILCHAKNVSEPSKTISTILYKLCFGSNCCLIPPSPVQTSAGCCCFCRLFLLG